MQKTIQANIGSMVFALHEEAYLALENYLNEIKTRFEAKDHFILEDIESRIAEILQEEVSVSSPIVDLQIVNRAIERIGAPETFGERKQQQTKSTNDAKTANTTKASTKRLYRLRNNRIIAGVCSGLGKYFGLPAWVFRVIAGVSLCFASIGFWVYLILWICIPSEPQKTTI